MELGVEVEGPAIGQAPWLYGCVVSIPEME